MKPGYVLSILAFIVAAFALIGGVNDINSCTPIMSAVGNCADPTTLFWIVGIGAGLGVIALVATAVVEESNLPKSPIDMP